MGLDVGSGSESRSGFRRASTDAPSSLLVEGELTLTLTLTLTLILTLTLTLTLPLTSLLAEGEQPMLRRRRAAAGAAEAPSACPLEAPLAAPG